jgi:hypothetical protein
MSECRSAKWGVCRVVLPAVTTPIDDQACPGDQSRIDAFGRPTSTGGQEYVMQLLLPASALSSGQQ